MLTRALRYLYSDSEAVGITLATPLKAVRDTFKEGVRSPVWPTSTGKQTLVGHVRSSGFSLQSEPAGSTCPILSGTWQSENGETVVTCRYQMPVTPRLLIGIWYAFAGFWILAATIGVIFQPEASLVMRLASLLFPAVGVGLLYAGAVVIHSIRGSGAIRIGRLASEVVKLLRATETDEQQLIQAGDSWSRR